MRIVKSGLAALAMLSAGTAFAGVPSWSFSESAGQVIVASPGVSRVAKRNDVLKVGDIVSTGPNGRAVVVRGQEYLVVAPNSRFRIADPAKSGGLTQIVEQAGNIVYRIQKKTTPHFGVQTPYLAAVVKGTTFSVTVDANGATVQVIEGKVEVATRDGGATYMVLPGDIGSVSATAMQTLDVKGRETRQLVSPLPPAAMPPADAESTEATPALWEDAPKPSLDGVVVTAVGEGAVKLDAVSDGLVRGDSSLTAVVATTVVASRTPAEVRAETPPAPVPVTPGSATDTGNAGSAGAPTVDPVPAPTPPTPAPVVVAVTTPDPAPVVTPPAPTPIAPAPVVVAAVTLPPVIAPTQPTVSDPVSPGNGTSGNGGVNNGSSNGNGNSYSGNGNGGSGNGNSYSGNGNGGSGNGNGNGNGGSGNGNGNNGSGSSDDNGSNGTDRNRPK